MEQHPIPRNISSFQFHLVGDMTLKQFGFLAGGVIIAYIIYKLPLPSLITLPIAFLIALTGVAFAFLPIQERPLDRWLIAFIKSIYSPTQFIWRKNNPPLALLTQELGRPLKSLTHEHAVNHQIAGQKLNAYLSSLPPAFDKSVSQKEKAYLDNTLSLFNTTNVAKKTITPNIIPVQPPPAQSIKPPLTSSHPQTSSPPIVKSITQESTSQTPKPQAVKTVTPAVSHPSENRLAELEQKLKELLSEKEILTALKSQNEILKTDTAANKNTPTIKVIDENSPPSQGIPSVTTQDFAGMPSIPSVGNIIIGVVRDNLKRLLPGIIITVKDPSGMPVRALKSNKLGQFAAATPLQNGHYFIEIEDPQTRFHFDTIEIELVGKVFMPIEVIAKGQREILRDKLSHELFGSQTL